MHNWSWIDYEIISKLNKSWNNFEIETDECYRKLQLSEKHDSKVLTLHIFTKQEKYDNKINTIDNIGICSNF